MNKRALICLLYTQWCLRNARLFWGCIFFFDFFFVTFSSTLAGFTVLIRPYVVAQQLDVISDGVALHCVDFLQGEISTARIRFTTGITYASEVAHWPYMHTQLRLLDFFFLFWISDFRFNTRSFLFFRRIYILPDFCIFIYIVWLFEMFAL